VRGEWAGLEFTGSGFLTAQIGTMLDGSVKGINALGYNCPCQIVDYKQGGLYENGGGRFEPMSKLGLQGSVGLTQQLSITSQVLVRGVAQGQPDLEWMYGTYQLTPATKLQLGRQRLPLYYYSESQEVGFSHPYAVLPQQTYGWWFESFNGLNVTHQQQLFGWSTSLNLYAGYETALKNPFNKLFSGPNYRVDDKAEDLAGIKLQASKAWFEVALSYAQFNRQTREPIERWAWSEKSRVRFYGLPTMLTPDNWLLHTELYSMSDALDDSLNLGGTAAVGYHLGDWLPMLSYSAYDERTLGYGNLVNPEKHSTFSASVRYDLNHWSDVKVQYNLWFDNSSNSEFNRLYGNSQALFFSYDLVF
jgi:hypothetical protein